ncbi:salicylate hydroxylase [Blastomyces dermatitidis ER-3]|uniref:Salicylate hydroxylase n=4 Tax=Blastomyces TaxID=229219 RepID=A0A179UJG9_BLAGS|nr:salicylate hydroxylase [Blastomyces gilchristii SLH14081]XP_045282280.1 salicylate hydroxylase [Blastomyces dermatitidis ER-3]OAT02553.1 salicylate hydroxylase [Blastomyces dermatitidis ER-3]OAT07368.1 salicylate hydroxylase [Blastomyces gilchristii SLH14081]
MEILQARRPLRVVVVGAGIGGLATAISLAIRGHRILILESAPQIRELGAGIQISPNMRSVLRRLGVEPAIKKTSVVLERIQVVRWQDGRVLNETAVNHQYGEAAAIHRGDLQKALLDRILELDNIQIRAGATVTDIDFDLTAVHLQCGKAVYGDVVIAADGIKSTVRRKMFPGIGHRVQPSGDVAFRILIPREKMLEDEETAKLINKPQAVRWVGPHRHVIGYPIRNHQLYNSVFVHPDNGPTGESWTIPGTREEIMEAFGGWDPRLSKLVASSTSVLKSRLCLHPRLQTWVKGSCALVGDACHPMLPYIAQGAAQALEDAAALGVVLSQIETAKDVPFALYVYEKCRKARAERIQQSGTDIRIELHLPDGPEQVKRDERFAAAMKGAKNPDTWNDRETQRAIWGYDAEEAARKCWSSSRGIKGAI